MKKILLPILLLTPLVIFSQAPTPTVFWNFNGNVNAVSANTVNSTGSNVSYTTDRNTVANNAAYFNGVNSRIVISTVSPFNASTGYALVFWARPEASSFEGYIFAKHTPGRDIMVSYKSDGLYSTHFARNSTSYNILNETNVTPLNSWNHIAIVYTGLSQHIYRNGVLSSSRNTTSTPSNNGQEITIGSFGTSDYFKGAIDDLAFFNHSLTEQDVRAMYDIATGIENNVIYSAETKAYPNPTEDAVILPFSAQWTFSDSFGSTLLEVNGKNANIGSFPSGIYNVKSGNTTFRIIKR